MSQFLKPYFETEGPFGLPMKDRQAKALESRLRDLPKEEIFSLHRCALGRGIAELSAEGRCDVSWITEETPDRAGDVVVARGMDDSHFQLNPIVTLNHMYDRPPVGRSLWRRKVKEGPLVGVKAKTAYPERPESWTGGEWPPDTAFELVKAGLLRGKSIGFFPLEVRQPTSDEIARMPAWKDVRYVIEKWLLAEYACCFLPMQPNAVVEEICKAFPGPLPESVLEALQLQRRDTGVSQKQTPAGGFTTIHEIEQALPQYLLATDLENAVAEAVQRSWKKRSGRV